MSKAIEAWRNHVLELAQHEFHTWEAVSTEVVVWEHELPPCHPGSVLMGTAIVVLKAKGGREPNPCVAILTTSGDREPAATDLGCDVVIVDLEAVDALGRALATLRKSQ